MVVGFTSTCAISSYHNYGCEFESHSCEVYSIELYVINFVSGMLQVSGFLWVPKFLPPIIDHFDITEILLKVALKAITLTPETSYFNIWHIHRDGALMGTTVWSIVFTSTYVISACN
jgi:hypothetical protein